ncbi:MAG TPA: PadR family transcriptional regulator [Solirubrobacteraceae bacterium]
MTAIATTHWAGPLPHHEPRAGKRRAGKKHHAGKVLLGAALMRAMAEGRRRHGGHRGFGPGPGWVGPGSFGPGGFGPFGRGGRGKRARRGDVRAAILLLLEEEARNGYQLMQELEERSGGVWRPSPGSIYPALSQLEDEGLVRSDENAGRRAFQLTDAGRAYIEENREALGSPWDDVGGDLPEGVLELRKLMMQLGMATMQVAQAGDEAQTAEAHKVLEDARRSLYRILAGDAGDEPAAD